MENTCSSNSEAVAESGGGGDSKTNNNNGKPVTATGRPQKKSPASKAAPKRNNSKPGTAKSNAQNGAPTSNATRKGNKSKPGTAAPTAKASQPTSKATPNSKPKPEVKGGDKKKDGPPLCHSCKLPPRPPPEMTAENMWDKADLSKFKMKELRNNGAMTFMKIGKQEQIKGKSVQKGIQMFKANPRKYICMTYQASMNDPKIWPENQHAYTLYHRKGTEQLTPASIAADGWQAVLINQYNQLPPFKDDILPSKFRDKYTDDMVHKGKKIHSGKIKPIMPGRGMGCADNPLLKIIGDVDPSDIHQGEVGDCWLLSAISAIAEFDGAVKKLFRKTKNLDKMPRPEPNMYTVTLWDLETWKEVDIVIDERLAASQKNGNVLSSKPSEDGELWVCYLEKALAIHCGGWDAISGGQSTHAWAMMTGCKEQYMIKRNLRTKLFCCYAKLNPVTNQWPKHTNNPKKSDSGVWKVGWPKVGGGEGREKECTEDELFKKLYAFDQVNYIVAAGTVENAKGKQDAGLVVKHAYTVIEAVQNAAGTGIDLLKVRNPWGSGEIEDGEFDDDGPGWNKYPQIKKLLNPVVADDGIFWVTKKEFFKFYGTIYVSASNMTEFLED